MKYRMVASVAWEVEITDAEIQAFKQENKEEGYDVSDWPDEDVASEMAYDKFQMMTLAEASWDNVHEIERVKE
jgi:hypothetical protein